MKKCDIECEPICDFCKHYTFNKSDPDEGYCDLLKKNKSPIEGCFLFHCFRRNDNPKIQRIA